MAGNFRSGRRAEEEPPAIDPKDRPTRPSKMLAEEVRFWDQCIAPAKHLTKADTHLARSCCELWGLYRKAYELAKKDPADKVVRIAVTNYFQSWKTAMLALGLDPLGRLRTSKATKRGGDNSDPLTELGIVG